VPTIHPSLSDVAQARVGTRIRNKWRVDKLLGVGGMGAVYAATHRNGSRVALKVLHPQLSVLADIRARFAREGYVANAVNHPGVVRVLDDDETEDGAAFLVMELLEGENADARFRRLGGRLPIDDVLLLADGLLDVLVAAHAAGIVHRDIKPENVFLTRHSASQPHSASVKVLDFGIARLRATSGIDDIPPDDASLPHLRTRTGVTIGTPAFMPPEQALGRTDEVDAASDIWAVGATMFMLLSGRIVHDAKTHMEVVIAAATAQARSLAQFVPDAPQALVDVVDRALAFKKEDRWSSARAMQSALRAAVVPGSRMPTGPGELVPGGSSPPMSLSAFGSQPPGGTGIGSGRWAEERKLATVLFGDVVGLSVISNELEPDSAHELAKAFFEPLAQEIEREGGTVLKFIGDKVMAVFGVPVTREDDAARAVRTAIAMAARVREIARNRGHQDIGFRAGVNTGLVMVGVVGAGTRATADIMGATVNLASRIEESAETGAILIGGPTERLVNDHFELASVPPLPLKSGGDALPLFRVEGERQEAPASSMRLRSASGTPFFARQSELERLLHMYDVVAVSGRPNETGHLRVAEIIGEMGLGKGHLLRQLRIALAAREPEPHILHATRVLGGAPLGFVGKMLRARFNVRVDESPEAVRARVVDAVATAWDATEVEDGRDAGRMLADLVAPTPVAPLIETELSTDATRTVSAFADWVRRLARSRPVVMLVEQVQWTDQGSRDLLQYLIRSLRRERVFLVTSARPASEAGGRDGMNAPFGADDGALRWTTGSDVWCRLELQPFSEEVMDRFLDDLFRLVPNFPRDVRQELLRRAEGNPELCKELVRLLVDRGALWVDEQRVPIKWDKNRSAKLDLPDTVRGVLQARLDGLPPLQKEILKVASVVGRVFWVGLLEELLPRGDNGVPPEEIKQSLDSLRARELLKLQPTSSVSGERELMFATQALCDAAYELVPRVQSVALHRKVAEWLSGRGELWEGGQANLARHLEAAGEKPRARRLFLNAARHAISVCAYPEAIGFFERARALWKDESSSDERIARAGVMRECAVAQTRNGRFEDALRTLEAAEQDLRASGVGEEDAVHGWLLLERGLVLKEYGRMDESIELLARAADSSKGLPASLLQMRIHAALAFQRSSRGDRAGASEHVAEGIRVGRELHVRDAGWHVAMARLKDAEGAIHFHGGELLKAEEAYRAALELRELAGDTQGMPDGFVNLGGVAYTRGDYAAAVVHYERALSGAKKARWLAREAVGHSNLGQAKLALGELEMAASELDRACRLADDNGYRDVLADSARALAEVELGRGNIDAAVERANAAIQAAEESKNAMFVAMAHATAMDVFLAKLHKSRNREAFERAKWHKEEACAKLEQLGQKNAAESVAKRFGRGSNATVDT
jgi:class 3 adenylate cyclase/tetratricopeptide (TPR) repeat protein